uniref:Uncharacterized protein n=1 Tax=Utricularia reniformis TaxID=192314 RepID=A0A1Y0B221_9LAMI|nr:hypothetical protein AEK19_MT1217 [Utricularia reniformis]ART31431.1 hypothetical protein AEK19_MT1217 [Utricularia reniformis]
MDILSRASEGSEVEAERNSLSEDLQVAVDDIKALKDELSQSRATAVRDFVDKSAVYPLVAGTSAAVVLQRFFNRGKLVA